ncbi:hypothetical protein, partial [Burkholderia ubonensis]|uniref:hypothetical protein n=1 Tax=Burkholderia ubonensis TaxID=101571 RepID=UPI001C435E3B
HARSPSASPEIMNKGSISFLRRTYAKTPAKASVEQFEKSLRERPPSLTKSVVETYRRLDKQLSNVLSVRSDPDPRNSTRWQHKESYTFKIPVLGRPLRDRTT